MDKTIQGHRKAYLRACPQSGGHQKREKQGRGREPEERNTMPCASSGYVALQTTMTLTASHLQCHEPLAFPDTRTAITSRASSSSEKVREGARGSLVGSVDVLVTAIEESE